MNHVSGGGIVGLSVCAFLNAFATLIWQGLLIVCVDSAHQGAYWQVTPHATELPYCAVMPLLLRKCGRPGSALFSNTLDLLSTPTACQHLPQHGSKHAHTLQGGAGQKLAPSGYHGETEMTEEMHPPQTLKVRTPARGRCP